MPKRPRLVRGKDYVIDDDGKWEFTREYLLNLGACCKNECRYCPYGHGKPREAGVAYDTESPVADSRGAASK